ncbi:MAG TPA: MBL fold metallo-hydrolase [Solirubrobacteraceae bacterium]
MVDGAVMGRAATAADRIVFLGHATVLIEIEGVRLLTDPLLRDRVAHLRRQVPPVDLDVSAGRTGPLTVLISHLHRDHLDLASLRLLGLDTPLLVPSGAGAWLRRRRFTDVTELRVGEVANVGALEVSAVEARHDGRRWPGPGGPRAETLGYIVRGRQTIYFAGDTELFDGISSLAPSPDGDDISEAARRLDLALLPVAGWAPKLGRGHMDPLDAARAAALLRPRLAIPIHWGTLLPLGIAHRHRARLEDPPHVFAEHVASLAPSVEVRTLMPGQETKL